jgi:hypothetical protein
MACVEARPECCMFKWTLNVDRRHLSERPSKSDRRYKTFADRAFDCLVVEEACTMRSHVGAVRHQPFR